jgi:hypothetical protein
MLPVRRQPSEESPMPSVPTAKVLAPGEGKTIMLYGVRFDFEELAPVLGDKAPPSEYDALAERYGLTIENDWIEELEATYGVKL